MHDSALWALMKDVAIGSEKGATKGSKDSSSSDESSSDEGDDLDFDASDALEDRRAELAALVVAEPEPFFWNLRGGQWTAHHLGVAYDSYRSQARAGRPANFCVLHGLAQSATFSIARYGEGDCLFLVKLWMNRMRFLFELYEASGCEGKADFRHVDLSAYALTEELQAWLTACAGQSRIRAMQIRDLKP